MKKNMLWNAAGNLTYLICQWLVTIFVTRLGGFSDAGVLSIAMSISATFQTLAMFGIRNFQVSDTEGKYTDSAYVSFRIVTCLAALIGCMAFSLVTAYRGETLLAIFLFMLFRLAENFSDVLHGIAQKNGRLDIAGKSFLMKGVGLLAAFLIAYILTDRLTVALLCMAILSCLTTALYDIPAVRKLSRFGMIPRREQGLHRLVAETAPLCVYLFLSAALLTVPKLILEHVRGEDVLGAYSSIFAPAVLIQAAMGYLYIPFAQVFAELHAKRDIRGFLQLFGKLTAAIVGFAVISTIGAYFLGEPLLVLIFKETIRPFAHYLLPIIVASALTAYFTFLCMLATVLRTFRWLLLASGVALVAELLLTAPWIKARGVNATSYSLILAMSLASLILLGAILLRLFFQKEKGEPDGTNR